MLNQVKFFCVASLLLLGISSVQSSDFSDGWDSFLSGKSSEHKFSCSWGNTKETRADFKVSKNFFGSKTISILKPGLGNWTEVSDAEFFDSGIRINGRFDFDPDSFSNEVVKNSEVVSLIAGIDAEIRKSEDEEIRAITQKFGLCLSNSLRLTDEAEGKLKNYLSDEVEFETINGQIKFKSKDVLFLSHSAALLDKFREKGNETIDCLTQNRFFCSLYGTVDYDISSRLSFWSWNNTTCNAEYEAVRDKRLVAKSASVSQISISARDNPAILDIDFSGGNSNFKIQQSIEFEFVVSNNSTKKYQSSLPFGVVVGAYCE